MRKIQYHPTNTRRIISKNNPRLNAINITPSRKYVSGGTISNNIIYIKDKAFSTIAATTFEDAYSLDLLWKNNIPAEILRLNMSSDVASITKTNNSYSLNKAADNLSNTARAELLTNAGQFLSRPLSFHRAVKPIMYIFEGYKPNSLSRSIYNSLKNLFDNRPSFPSGNINYDVSSWTGLFINDIRIIINASEKQNYITVNKDDKYAANYVYIDKSVFPNKLLKWASWSNQFVEIGSDDLYIIQNDGRWNPNSNTTSDSLDSGEIKYKLNPFFYGKNLDFSGVTVFCSTGDSSARRTKTGTLVTKRHTVHAKHGSYTPSVGSVLRFVSKNGNIIERTVVQRYTDAHTDLGMTLLDQDVPDDVSVYKVFPTNIDNYVPEIDGTIFNTYIKNYLNNYIYANILRGYQLLQLEFNQNKTIQSYIGVGNELIKPETWDQNLVLKNNTSSAGGVLSQFMVDVFNYIPYQQSITGDSGSPQFHCVNNTELILKGLVAAIGAPHPFSSLFSHINNTITNHLGVPGQVYQAEAIDCSNFEFFD
jgi:hypothetical protein